MNALVAAQLNFELCLSSDQHEPCEVDRCWKDAFEALAEQVETNNVDVIHIAETTGKLDEDGMEVLAGDMKRIGLVEGVYVPSPRPRDSLVQTMWKREGAPGSIAIIEVGKDGMRLPVYRIPGVLELLGMHNPSDSPDLRKQNAEKLVAYAQALRQGEAEASGSNDKLTSVGVLTDFNETYPEVCTSARLLHRVDTYIRRIPGVDDMDLFAYGRIPVIQKIRKIASLGIRGAAMTRAEGLAVMLDGGFKDAAQEFNDHTTTVTHGPLRMPIDHTFMMGEQVRMAGYTVLPRMYDTAGKPLTDHNMTLTTLVW